MANKPEYVDLISEVTRQHRRRAQPLAAGDVAAVEAREFDAVEVGFVEAEGLALGCIKTKGAVAAPFSL